MDKYHMTHTLYLAETMLADAREMEHSELQHKATYEKVDTAGWRLEWKQPSIKIYENIEKPYYFMIVATSRKRNYIRFQDYNNGGKQ